MRERVMEAQCERCFAHIPSHGCQALKKDHGYHGDCPFFKPKEELNMHQIEMYIIWYGGKK